MALYRFNGTRCHQCLFRQNEFRHFKRCIPEKYWPPREEWADPMPVGPSNQTIYLDDVPTLSITDRHVTHMSAEGVVTAHARASDVITCECNWAVPAGSKNPAAALRMHRAKSKVHASV